MAGLHNLKRMTKRSYRRIGRGQGSKRGKTSGRGTKGAGARAGNKGRPEWRDIIKKLPKRRGFGKNRGRTVFGDRPRPIVVQLAQVERVFSAGAEVTAKTMIEQGLLNARKMQNGLVKIIGVGPVSKKLSIKGCAVTVSVREAVEKAGGTIS